MNIILANNLFQDKEFINSIFLEENKDVTLDFKGVENFDLECINVLLNFRKLAILNNVSLLIKNITPSIENILYETGIYKIIGDLTTKPIRFTKRFNLT